MSKKIFRTPNHEKVLRKNPGTVLFITVILSGLIVTVGLTMMKIFATEIQFSANLLHGERAYFGAESGVEIALLELKNEPVDGIDVDIFSPTEVQEFGTKINLKIQNRFQTLAEKTMRLMPQQTQKLRLKTDTDLGRNEVIQAVETFSFSVNPASKILWKILCRKNGKTVALQNINSGSVFSSDNLFGVFDDETGQSIMGVSVSNLFNQKLGTNDEKKSCFLSLTNLEGNEIVLDFQNSPNLPPAQAKIKSIGRSGPTQKLIVFRYAQKSLSSFFDFGLFHHN